MYPALRVEEVSQSPWYVKTALLAGTFVGTVLFFYTCFTKEEAARLRQYQSAHVSLEATLASLGQEVARHALARRPAVHTPQAASCVQSRAAISQFKFVGTIKVGLHWLGLIMLANGKLLQLDRGYCVGKMGARIMDIKPDRLKIAFGTREKTFGLSEQIALEKYKVVR